VVAAELLRDAETARKRIADGIQALQDPKAFAAFQMANRTMAKAARQRSPELYRAKAPKWRPFQLAFVLMNVRGIVDPSSADRRAVDLLFFPTGGGKTEAYLGLAAFTMVLRRLRNPGVASAGMSVLMRYTLRLLTLDQLGRAATLVCALELERRDDEAKEPGKRLGLGPWPFEIGLWVGQAATPNRMGHKGDNDKHSARTKTIAFQNDSRKPAPIPIENCPWCNTKFDRGSFHLEPSTDHPTDLRIACSQRRCAFGGTGTLPIVTVDEVLYRRVPAFLIATVDKFAQLPWVGRCGALFGKVDRHAAGRVSATFSIFVEVTAWFRMSSSGHVEPFPCPIEGHPPPPRPAQRRQLPRQRRALRSRMGARRSAFSPLEAETGAAVLAELRAAAEKRRARNAPQ
jgi:hypothetical protein